MSDDWWERIACKGVDPNVFEFRSSRRREPVSQNEKQRLHNTLAICASCPVKPECHDYMLSWPDPPLDMVIAGMTAVQARKAWFDSNQPQPHGTTWGYQKHLIAGSPPCDLCRQVHNYSAARNKARRRWRTT